MYKYRNIYNICNVYNIVIFGSKGGMNQGGEDLLIHIITIQNVVIGSCLVSLPCFQIHSWLCCTNLPSSLLPNASPPPPKTRPTVVGWMRRRFHLEYVSHPKYSWGTVAVMLGEDRRYIGLLIIAPISLLELFGGMECGTYKVAIEGVRVVSRT